MRAAGAIASALAAHLLGPFFEFGGAIGNGGGDVVEGELTHRGLEEFAHILDGGVIGIGHPHAAHHVAALFAFETVHVGADFLPEFGALGVGEFGEVDAGEFGGDFRGLHGGQISVEELAVFSPGGGPVEVGEVYEAAGKKKCKADEADFVFLSDGHWELRNMLNRIDGQG